jgi:hypothetical protein
MRPRYSSAYWDSLFSLGSYEGLVSISQALCTAPKFSIEEAEYGLPRLAFMFVEGLCWFAQATRSGVWTYFEATPETRQAAMLEALEASAPKGFAARYATGMRDWMNESEMEKLDRWIKSHDTQNNSWLWSIAEQHRGVFEQMWDDARAEGTRFTS